MLPAKGWGPGPSHYLGILSGVLRLWFCASTSHLFNAAIPFFEQTLFEYLLGTQSCAMRTQRKQATLPCACGINGFVEKIRLPTVK